MSRDKAISLSRICQAALCPAAYIQFHAPGDVHLDHPSRVHRGLDSHAPVFDLGQHFLELVAEMIDDRQRGGRRLIQVRVVAPWDPDHDLWPWLVHSR